MKELISEQQVQARVAEMAHDINAQYDGKPLTIIGIMTGSIILLSDLIRQLTMPLRVGVVQASSYRGETERGELVIDEVFFQGVQEFRVGRWVTGPDVVDRFNDACAK